MININLFSKINQIVEPSKEIIFDALESNCDIENKLGYIKFLNAGIYIINFSAFIHPECKIILYKNDNIEIESLSSNIHHVIKLLINDIICIKNDNHESINLNNINLNIISISLYSIKEDYDD